MSTQAYPTLSPEEIEALVARLWQIAVSERHVTYLEETGDTAGEAATAIESLSDQLAEAQRQISGYQKECDECEQIAGKALGYPWFAHDQKNFPGATESDGVCIGEHVPGTIVAELAQKLAEARAECSQWAEAVAENARSGMALLARAETAERLLAQERERSAGVREALGEARLELLSAIDAVLRALHPAQEG